MPCIATPDHAARKGVRLPFFGVSEIITQINESQNAIAGAVEEQSVMTSEISRNISEVVNSSDEIVQSIYKVSDSAKNTTTAANLDEFAEELLEVVA